MRAKVYLVGAGPGDPELLTVKAVRLLRSADIVLHDALVSEEILQIARPNAQLVDVGKRVGEKRLTQDAINQLLVDLSDCADVIVRLKGGDPSIFGRAAEEMSALRQAGIEFEVVPGITAALAAAAQAGITLTDRQSAAGVIFLTAQQATGKGRTNIARYASQDSTLVIYMPTGHYREIRSDLIAAGAWGWRTHRGRTRSCCGPTSRLWGQSPRRHRPRSSSLARLRAAAMKRWLAALDGKEFSVMLRRYGKKPPRRKGMVNHEPADKHRRVREPGCWGSD
jgi:uroporphyrin-III C-methyltransferase